MHFSVSVTGLLLVDVCADYDIWVFLQGKTPPLPFLLALSRPAVRRAPTCMTTACCCPVASTSSEGWSLCVARWPRKVTIQTQRMPRRMTRMSGGVEQIQTMQMGGKMAFVFRISQMLNHQHIVLFIVSMYLFVSHQKSFYPLASKFAFREKKSKHEVLLCRVQCFILI